MRRRICVILAMLSCLTGCGYEFDVDTTNQEVTKTALYDEPTNEAKTATKIDGITYYKGEPQKETKYEKGMIGTLITDDIFVQVFPSKVFKETDSVFVNVTMPKSIHISNGVIVENTAHFSSKTLETDNPVDSIYAYTEEGMKIVFSDKDCPLVDNLTYNGFYKKFPRELMVSDNLGVAYVMLDNRSIYRCNDCWKYDLTDKDIVLKDGKHMLRVFDFNGNETIVRFSIDTKKPKIKVTKKYVYIDEPNLDVLRVNGKEVSYKQVKKGQYRIKNKDIQTLMIKDRANNYTIKSL